MRLEDLVGFEVGRDLLAFGVEYRLCLYIPTQSQAVYVSNVFHRSDELEDVDFQNPTIKRLFTIAIQILQNIGENWIVHKQWIIDLRDVKLDAVLAKDGIVLKTVNGNASVSESKLNVVLSDEDESQAPSTEEESNSWFNWGRGALNLSLSPKPKTKKKDVLVSISYPQLVDLWSLEHSIDEARAKSLKISSEVDELIPHSSHRLVDQSAVLKQKLLRIRKQINAERTKSDFLRQKTAETQETYAAIAQKLHDSVEKTKTRPLGGFNASKNKELEEKIHKEQSRLAVELLEVFPIEPVPDGKFHFSINGLMLPSVFAINHYDTTQVGAALGFVAQVVNCISRYLDIALPYPITICGSQSYITDNISRIKHGSIDFPLWTRGVLLYRVEYALYLLHKDIEQLLTRVGLAVVDLKQTLANLKNLLLVISCNK